MSVEIHEIRDPAAWNAVFKPRLYHAWQMAYAMTPWFLGAGFHKVLGVQRTDNHDTIAVTRALAEGALAPPVVHRVV
jgi:hypothetical protein